MSKDQPLGYVPSPTVRASVANGLQVFADDVVPFLVVTFLITTFGGTSRGLVVFEGTTRIVGILSTVLIATPLELGMSFVCLRAIRSGRVRFEHLIAVANRYWPVIVATTVIAIVITIVLIASIVSGATIAMIIASVLISTIPGAPLVVIMLGLAGLTLLPGVYLYCMTRFVPFLLLEDELSGVAAIKESFRLSRGHEQQLLGICAVGLLGTVLGMISVVGLIPALIWWKLSLASFYHAITQPPKGWAVEDHESLEEPEDSEAQE